jgi:hypothetical protein
MRIPWPRTSKLKTILFQTASLIGQVGVQVFPVVPDKHKDLVHLVITIAQGVQALQALHSNPDGTPAEVAYHPDKTPIRFDD